MRVALEKLKKFGKKVVTELQSFIQFVLNFGLYNFLIDFKQNSRYAWNLKFSYLLN